MRNLMIALVLSVASVGMVNAQSYSVDAKMGKKLRSYVFTQPAAAKRIIKIVEDSAFNNAALFVNDNGTITVSKVGNTYKAAGIVSGVFNSSKELSSAIVTKVGESYPAIVVKYTAKKNSKPRKSNVHNTTKFTVIANRAQDGIINMYKGDKFIAAYILADDLTWTKSSTENTSVGATKIISPNVELIKVVL
jgi:hypothetical protein